MNILDKVIIDRKVKKTNNENITNDDIKFIKKYEGDVESLVYLFHNLIEKNYNKCSVSYLISLLYVYTNDDCVVSKKFDTYTKNIIKDMILGELSKRLRFSNIKSDDLYCLLSNLKNEKTHYKSEFEKKFLSTGELCDIKKYCKNNNIDSSLLCDILKNEPNQCLKLAKQYNSKEDEEILLPLDVLQHYVETNNDELLIIDFAANVKNANIKKLENYICYRGTYYIYKFLTDVKNCDRKKLYSVLKARKEYYYLILAMCELGDIDLSKVSVKTFNKVLQQLNVINGNELLSRLYRNYDYVNDNIKIKQLKTRRKLLD